MIDAIEAKKPAIVMISTSRFLMCDELVRHDALELVRLERVHDPGVAQTTALFFERPIANAFGIAVSATAIFGFGRSAWMQRRSIIACRPGASCGETSLAPIDASASLSDRKSWASEQPADDDEHDREARAGREQRADQDDVQQPQQEDREEHPDLESGVPPERCLLRAMHRSLARTGSRSLERQECGLNAVPCYVRCSVRARKLPCITRVNGTRPRRRPTEH